MFDVSKPWLNRVLEGGHLEFLKAVDGVTFDISKGETFALVGESGSGKTTVARMVVGLLPPSSGEVVIDGVSMTTRQAQARRELRRRIQMIFQDPYASLNPRFRVDAIIAEPIRAFDLIEGERDIKARVGELLTLVGLHADDGAKYPHEFSGGQRQRIAIARALASEAEFIVCDEPTSALDVSVQAQILNLMRDLQDKFGLTYLFISHNLAVVRHMASRIGVMYLGRIVEIAAAASCSPARAALHKDAARRRTRSGDVRPATYSSEGIGILTLLAMGFRYLICRCAQFDHVQCPLPSNAQAACARVTPGPVVGVHLSWQAYAGDQFRGFLAGRRSERQRAARIEGRSRAAD